MKSLVADAILVVTLALVAGGCGEPPNAYSSSSQALAVATPALASITFWERSSASGPTPFTFAANAPQMLERLADPLSYSNHDFYGISSGEYYDVFYSNANGSFDASGRFITVEAVWNQTWPLGGGLNLAEVQLYFADGTSRFANVVTSYNAMGDNADATSVGNAVDGDLATHTTMGNTVGQTGRLRVTVGFEQPNQPPNCTGATSLPASIWPPDHRFVPVNVGGIDDPDGDSVTVEIVSVFQDEPVDSAGDGHFSPDAKITGASALLRAERSGNGDGRVYHVAFRASDDRGGSCEGNTLVCVPHDQRSGGACVDQGARFDSTAP